MRFVHLNTHCHDPLHWPNLQILKTESVRIGRLPAEILGQGPIISGQFPDGLLGHDQELASRRVLLQPGSQAFECLLFPEQAAFLDLQRR